MDDLKAQALRLLDRDPPSGPPVLPEVYRPGSLPALIEDLCRPENPLDGPALVSLCLKYCFNYVHPEYLEADITLEDVTRLAGQFVLRRGGSPLLEDRGGLRRFLLHHGFALQMLLDLPKTVHLLTALAGVPRPLCNRPFVGLDLGAGTGILLLGLFLLARRSGFGDWRLTGLERLPQVAARADLLLSRLGVGRVVPGDASKPDAYRDWVGAAIDGVANETLPSAGRRMYKEPFPVISQALFATLGPGLAGARFLPEAVWVSDREARAVLRLSPENAFAGREPGGTDDGNKKPLRLYYMRDVELAGQRIPVAAVGQAFGGLVAGPWREVLGRRW